MADYGIKISQPFYDATTAADANLLFSSSWPTMPIAAEKTYTNNLYGGDTDFSAFSLTFNHNLGFVPFTVVWVTTYSPRYAARNIAGFTMDTNNIYFPPSTSLYQIHITAYNINLGTDVEYPYIKTSGTTAPYDNDYGIKIVKSGKDISSTDMRDFILHSRCQSPQILTIKTDVSGVASSLGGGSYDILYTPSVTTPLWAFGFTHTSAGVYSGVNYYNQSAPRLFVTANTNGTYTYQLNYLPTGGAGASLIILRDPMFSSNIINASY